MEEKIKFFTYVNPKKWKEHPKFEEIKHCIHIASTKNLAEGIRERYEFEYIFSVKQVINNLFKEWSTSEYKLQQYLVLSKIIKEEVEKEKLEKWQETKEWKNIEQLKESFKKNSYQLLETIQYLVRAGLSPDNFQDADLSEKEVLLIYLWEKLENEQSSYQGIRDKISKNLENKEDVWEIFGIKTQDYFPTLVLHGFYYITPEQQNVLKLLKKSGCNIIFFQNYDPRFPTTFGFVDKFISKEYGWERVEEFIEKPNSTDRLNNGGILLAHFESEVSSPDSTEQQLYRYETFYEFLHEVIMKHYPHTPTDEDKSNCTIIATNADILNPLLVQYYPSLSTSQRNFLSYPIGQFILNIHEMCDNDELILNEKILMSTFSSGWLYDDESKINARDLTYELSLILPRFERCKKLSEWETEMDSLIKEYNNLNNSDIETVKKGLIKLSHLSLKMEDLEKIQKFIEKLKKIALNLFEKDKSKCDLNTHFTNIKEILVNYDPSKSIALTDEEKQIMVSIQSKIENLSKEDKTKTKQEMVLYEDLKEAIGFFLSGRFDEEEDSFIKPFIELDGEVLKDHNSKIYLTGLDENGIPLNQFKTPWPLQDSTYEWLGRHSIIKLDILRNQSIKCISRYLLFLALEFLPQDNLELSWIANFLDKKDLEPSIYMLLQNMKILNKSDEEHPLVESDEEHPLVESDEEHLLMESDEVFSESKLEISGYELLEYNFCPKRWYYSYVTDNHSVYKGKFIQRFIFDSMVKILRIKLGESEVNDKSVIDEAISKVKPFFPALMEIEKNVQGYKTIINFKYYNDSATETFLEPLRNSMLIPHLNQEDTFSKKKKKEEKKKEIDLKVELPSRSDKKCKYCPHFDLCPDAFIE